MTNKNDTSSVKAMVTVVALSALSLTTTLNTGGMTYSIEPSAIVSNLEINDVGTTTPSPKTSKINNQTMYDSAKELFNENMRGFTEKETEIYRASLKKIYKPIGVNIFDIC